MREELQSILGVLRWGLTGGPCSAYPPAQQSWAWVALFLFSNEPPSIQTVAVHRKTLYAVRASKVQEVSVSVSKVSL